MTIKPARLAIAALSLSAAGFVALVQEEDWIGTARPPTAGDRCTNGFGSTYREDGSPVPCGETIAPPKAVKRSYAHIAKDESGIKRCIGAALTQGEYDLMVDFAYQYGVPTLCASTIAREANAGNYAAACAGYLLYKRQAGRDCTRPENWGPLGCKGVWERSQRRYQKCMQEQSE